MKLIFVRHGDPDYEHDTLTETGWAEARAAGDFLSGTKIDYFYSSPLGRAKDTASCTTVKFGKEAVIKDWLREFPPEIIRPDQTHPTCVWDWLPEDWTGIPEFYDAEKWCQVPIMKEAGVPEVWQHVTESLDALLAEHGYERFEKYYRVKRENDDVIAFFCHFGLECALLAHLTNVSPMVLWHGFCAAPSSITTVYTEERREGKATFRIQSFGDLSHLRLAGLEPSFAARFCECYHNEDERHD